MNHNLKGVVEYRLSTNDDDFGWSSSSRFDYLEAGNYQIEIRDSSNCRKAKQVTLAEKNCYAPETGFNPNMDVWEYENQWEGEITISIYGKANELIYSETVDQDVEWNGTNNNGEFVIGARYLYIIEHNGVKQKSGYVTVLYNN